METNDLILENLIPLSQARSAFPDFACSMIKIMEKKEAARQRRHEKHKKEMLKENRIKKNRTKPR